jgi:hypothetical protein
MSNVILSAGWKGLRRELIVGWVALTGGAILFTLVGLVASRFGAGKEGAIAIALMATVPVAVLAILWMPGVASGKRKDRPGGRLARHFIPFSYSASLAIVTVTAFVWMTHRVDPIYTLAFTAIAAAVTTVANILLMGEQFILMGELSRLDREREQLERWRTMRRPRIMAAIRNLEQQEMKILWTVAREGEPSAAEAACLSLEETHAICTGAVEKFESSLEEVPVE